MITNGFPHFKKIFLNIVLIASLLPASLLAQDNARTHTVKQGDTLFSIAREYNVTVTELREWNNLEDDSTISTGRSLIISRPGENSISHTVEQGETLFSISRKYNVTIAEIRQWNNLESNDLKIGSELAIYPGEAIQSDESLSEDETAAEDVEEAELESLTESYGNRSTGYYMVKSGDSLIKIAREHDMTVEELKRLNNLQDDVIRIGQQLTVRKSVSAPSIAEAGDDIESTPQGKFMMYRVSQGETLESLLDTFKMTKSDLQALNPGSELSELNTGQRLTILLPPGRSFANPYRKKSGFQDLGQIPVTSYSGNEAASPTTSGELYNPEELTAAHANMALGSVVYIENPGNGKGIYVKINDRFSGDGIKLSEKAYEILQFSGPASVTIYQDS